MDPCKGGNLDLLKVDESGWKFGPDNMLEYNWYEDNIVPKASDADDPDDKNDIELISMLDAVYETEK